MAQANYPDPFSLPFKYQPTRKQAGEDEIIAVKEQTQNHQNYQAPAHPPEERSTKRWIAVAGVCVVAAVVMFFILAPLSAAPAASQAETGGTAQKTTLGINPDPGTASAGGTGEVTIAAAGDQSYYLGEKITFSGTNTVTGTTFLFLTGPGLPSNGAQIEDPDPRKAEISDGDATTFASATVNGDNTWSWSWGTEDAALDAGVYTVYAVSYPNDRNHLTGIRYGTTSIVLKKPFVSATIQNSVIHPGETTEITGSAEGNPPNGVQIWILGPDYVDLATVPVGPDGSFRYSIPGDTTAELENGMYYVIVQHPMQNARFDIVRSATNPNRAVNLQTGASVNIFSTDGLVAAQDLAGAFNDPDVDDTYTKLQFLVE